MARGDGSSLLCDKRNSESDRTGEANMNQLFNALCLLNAFLNPTPQQFKKPSVCAFVIQLSLTRSRGRCYADSLPAAVDGRGIR